MGREIKRKKKNNNNIVKNEITGEHAQVTSLIKLVVIVASVILVVYLFVGVFITKEINIKDLFTKKDNTKEEVSFDYKEILIGEIFNKNKDNYYVLCYDFKGYDSNLLNYVLSNNLKDKIYYIVNTNNSLNKDYIVESNGNGKVTNLDNLKVVNPTLIKITNKTIVEYVEGVDNIVSHLKALNK